MNLKNEFCEIKTYLGLLNCSIGNFKDMYERAKELMIFHMITGYKVIFNFNNWEVPKALAVLNLLTPMDVSGKKRCGWDLFLTGVM